MNDKPELKIVLGNKYNHQKFIKNPGIFVRMFFDFEYKIHVYVFQYYDKQERRCTTFLTEEDLINLTEYREPIKRSMEGWINYNSNDEIRISNILDELTGLFAGSTLHASQEIAKKNATPRFHKQKHIKLTCEEIIDEQ